MLRNYPASSLPDVMQEGCRSLDSLQQLAAAYASRLEPVPAEIDGRPVVVHTGADVPREVLIAAGFAPFRLPGRPGFTGPAEPYCGPGIDRAAVSRLARLLEGEAAASAGLVLSADDEGSVRLFLYLRELQRVEPRTGVPRLTFLDLLHLSQRTSAVYNRARLDALIEELGEWAGQGVSDERLRTAAAGEDRRRALLREVGERLRSGPGGPRLTGAQALAVVGAGFVMAAERWSVAVRDLLEADLPVQSGTRVFLTGCDHDHPAAYELLESLGAVVVGEDHGWGALAGEAAVGPADDIRAAILRSRTLAAPASAGAAAAVRAEQTVRMARACGADLVVVWTRPADDAPPWDVPVQRAALAEVGVPLVAVPPQPYGAIDEDEVAAVLEPVLGDPARAAAVLR